MEEGHEATVLDNLSSGSLTNPAAFDNVRFVEGDVRAPEVLEDDIRGADTVFHLAASVGDKRSIDFPIDDAAFNVMGTLQVLEAAKVRPTAVINCIGIIKQLTLSPSRVA